MKEKINDGLLELISSSVKDVMVSDYEERKNNFPYTKCTNYFFEKLQEEFNISFDEELISEKLFNKIVSEFVNEFTK